MTNPSDPHARPPLAADDPRLSEWIDGRLPAAEAAEVERAVRNSPALTRLADDLRAIKEAARHVPATAPPAGFTDRVMEAVLSAGDAAATTDAAADLAVEREWRQIETERIAEERAEAEVDRVAETAPAPAAAGRSWPWLTVAAALAAGLLVAVVLNRPEEGPREIATLTAEPELDGLKAVVRRDAAPADQAGSPPPAAEATGAAVPPPLAAAPAAPAPALARSLETNGRLRASRGEVTPDAAVSDKPVVLRVASWTEFDRLLEAHGIEAAPVEARDGEDRADESGDWTLELAGSPAGLEAFLAAARGDGLEKRRAAAGAESERKAEEATAERAKQAEQAEVAQGARRGPVGRLLVRLVIEASPEAKPAEPATGGEDGVRRE